MQKGKTIINTPLLVGSVLSIAIHVGALCSEAMRTPSRPMQEHGRTVVHLTLVPSVTQKASAPEQVPSKPSPEAVVKPELIPEPDPVITAAKTPTTATEEREASLIEDEGIISASSLPGASMPPYPRTSRRRGEEGSVLLSIEVLASGKAGTVEVLKSSGYRRLDDAAVQAAKKAAYRPASKRGRNIDSTLTQPFVFELTQ